MNCYIADATSQLLQLIDIDKAKALAGTIKFGLRFPKPGSGNRFEIPPNFRVPGLTPDRPVSGDGRVAFCLVHTVVVKEANYEKVGSRAQHYAVVTSVQGRTISTSASAFDRYICRESAVLKVAPEVDQARLEKNTGGVVPAIFTNIHPDPEVRDEFWEAVTRCGRKPSPDVVNLYPERLSEEQWAEIEDNYDGPAALMDALLRVQADLFVRIMPQPSGMNGAVAFKMRKRDFVAFRKHLKNMDAWNQNYPPASFKRGYSARIQRRLVAELPVGLTESAMSLIAHRFADYLAEKQLMYTVVVHAPDAHNDRRNHHLHAVVYDRPCKFLEEHGCWDFEYREPVPGQYNRLRFPRRQNKPRSPESDRSFREQAADEIMEIREVYAAICNEQLLKCGINRLFDHRSYKEMGIAQAPGRRISQRNSLLEAAGIPTALGTENAEKSWQGEFDRAIDAHRLRQESRRRCRQRTKEALNKARLASSLSFAAAELERHLRRFDELTAELGEREFDLTKLHLTLRMACSRAEKTYEMCQRVIDSIDSGTAKAVDLKWEDEIRDRQQAAEEHLDLIDAITADRIEVVNLSNLSLPDQVEEIDRTMEKMWDLAEMVEKEDYAIAPRHTPRTVAPALLDTTSGCRLEAADELEQTPAIDERDSSISPHPQQTSARQVDPQRYELALMAKKARDEEKRREATESWHAEFSEHFFEKCLPITFDGEKPVVDINLLPEHLAKLAEGLSNQVNKLIEREVDGWRVAIRNTLLSAPEPLVHYRNGQAEFDPMKFEASIRRQLRWLLKLDPVVRTYAEQAIIEARTRSNCPKIVQSEAPASNSNQHSNPHDAPLSLEISWPDNLSEQIELLHSQKGADKENGL